MASNDDRSSSSWRKSEKGNAEWIYANESPILAKHLRKDGRKKKFGKYVYLLREGRKFDFIVRYPIRGNQARNKEKAAA